MELTIATFVFSWRQRSFPGRDVSTCPLSPRVADNWRVKESFAADYLVRDTPSWTWSAMCASSGFVLADFFEQGVKLTAKCRNLRDRSCTEWMNATRLITTLPNPFHVFWTLNKEGGWRCSPQKLKRTCLESEAFSSTVRCAVFSLWSWTRAVSPVWWWSVTWDITQLLTGKDQSRCTRCESCILLWTTQCRELHY